MTRSTSKRNLRIGLIPDPLPRPNSTTTHQKILPSNFLPIPPVIASVDQVSPSISKTLPSNLLPIPLKLASTHPISSSIIKTLPSNLLAISIKIASIHPGSSPPRLTTTKQHWEPHRSRRGDPRVAQLGARPANALTPARPVPTGLSMRRYYDKRTFSARWETSSRRRGQDI